MKEVFKDIPNYEGMYQVSNLGNVKSLIFSKSSIKKQHLNNNGYCIVGLNINGYEKKYRVHQLVAMAFLGHTPNGFKGFIVDHINNIKTDNRLDNLQLITQRLNNSKDKKNKSSKYTGVYFHKKWNKWAAMIRINYKGVHLGGFTNEYDAHLAYQKALKECI